VNARLTYASAGDRYSVALYGKNLLDEHYFTTVFRFDSTGFNHVANVGDPRTYGVRFDVRF
jgi:outer membrane receptor protein involved in Fe transport